MSFLNGVQIPAKVGADFTTQYNAGDLSTTNKTTLANNAMFNPVRVLFEGKRTDSLGQSFGDIGAISTNGLKNVPPEIKDAGSKLITFT